MVALYYMFFFLAPWWFSVARATCPVFDTSARLPSSKPPPDPFTFLSGEKVITKEDWQCRRAELAALLQDIELGSLPPKPSVVNTALSGNRVNISIEHDNKKVTFDVTIKLPNNRSIADGPFSAIIAYGGPSIPLNGTDIATITYNNDQIASQVGAGSRGQGAFFNLYGSNHSAGSLIAWTWGISRVMDALELLGPDITGIDPEHVGLTGCSRNGRGVLVAGAFEERIALTIAQEGGLGGAACWHLYDELKCRHHCIPEEPELPWSTPWYRKEFPQNVGYNLETLPFDHHELIGMHAPRSLLILENYIDWLQPISTTVCGKAGREVYAALGVKEAYGYSMKGNHNHCQFPSNQQAVLTQYLERYLLGKRDGNREGVFESSAESNASHYSWSWTTPRLT